MRSSSLEDGAAAGAGDSKGPRIRSQFSCWFSWAAEITGHDIVRRAICCNVAERGARALSVDRPRDAKYYNGAMSRARASQHASAIFVALDEAHTEYKQIG